MNKRDMEVELAKRAGITYEKAGKYISILRDIIMDGIAQDGYVLWRGLGRFDKRFRNERYCPPLPGQQEMNHAEKQYTAHFYPGKELKRLLNKE